MLIVPFRIIAEMLAFHILPRGIHGTWIFRLKDGPCTWAGAGSARAPSSSDELGQPTGYASSNFQMLRGRIGLRIYHRFSNFAVIALTFFFLSQ